MPTSGWGGSRWPRSWGGRAALHVAGLTRRLGAALALVPPDPGLLSAYGMLASPVTREVSRTVLACTDQADVDGTMAGVFHELGVGGRALPRTELRAEGARRRVGGALPLLAPRALRIPAVRDAAGSRDPPGR